MMTPHNRHDTPLLALAFGLAAVAFGAVAALAAAVRWLFFVLTVLLVASCTPNGSPPPAQQVHGIVVAVRDAATMQGVPGATVRLGELNVTTDANGGAVFAVLVPQRHQLQVVHPDYVSLVTETFLTAGSSEWPVTLNPRPPPATVAPVLHVVGRDWYDGDKLYVPRWVSGLTLLTKTDVERDRFLTWAEATGFNGVRVFAGSLTWANQTPETARAALPGLIAATRARGLALEVTAVTDSGTGYDWRAHLRAVAALTGPEGHVVLEGANELGHPSQAPSVTPDAIAEVLAAYVGPWAVGAPLSQDEPIAGAWPAGQGRYSTVHLHRGGKDEGSQVERDPWNVTRRVREVYAVVEVTGRPALNNEPIGAGENHEPGRRFNDPVYFAVLGALDAAFKGVGGVHHSQAGLLAVVPGAREQACADAYVAAHRAVRGVLGASAGAYLNVGHAGSPLAAADFAKVVRVYSFVAGNRGVAVYVGAVDGPVGEQWANGWRPTRDAYAIRGTDGRSLRVVEISR